MKRLLAALRAPRPEFQTPNPKHQTPKCKLKPSNLAPGYQRTCCGATTIRTSHSQTRIPNTKHQTPSPNPQTLNPKHQTLNSRPQTSRPGIEEAALEPLLDYCAHPNPNSKPHTPNLKPHFQVSNDLPWSDYWQYFAQLNPNSHPQTPDHKCQTPNHKPPGFERPTLERLLAVLRAT